MPIYEYGCEACGHQLEIQQKLADAQLKTCPACGKEALQKLISSTAFVLKGSGWYKDGYGSGSKDKRSDNQVGDRLQKAVSDDKKKTESSPSSSTSTPAATSTPSSGTSSDGGGKSSTAPST